MPSRIKSVTKIYVVPATLFSTSSAVGLLCLKSRILKIFIKGHYLGHLHSVDHLTATPDTPVVAPTANDPITNIGGTPNIRFTGRKCAVTIKRVWCKAAIVPDDI